MNSIMRILDCDRCTHSEHRGARRQFRGFASHEPMRERSTPSARVRQARLAVRPVGRSKPVKRIRSANQLPATRRRAHPGAGGFVAEAPTADAESPKAFLHDPFSSPWPARADSTDIAADLAGRRAFGNLPPRRIGNTTASRAMPGPFARRTSSPLGSRFIDRSCQALRQRASSRARFCLRMTHDPELARQHHQLGPRR